MECKKWPPNNTHKQTFECYKFLMYVSFSLLNGVLVFGVRKVSINYRNYNDG